MDVNNWGPFQANVWGTFADYCMVAVTGYTLYYLRKTLKSQQHVQEDQNRIANIEQSRYEKETKPNFALIEPKVSHSGEGDSFSTELILFTFVLLQNTAFDIEFTAYPDSIGPSFGSWHLPTLSMTRAKMVQSQSEFLFGHFEGESTSNGPSFYIEFIITFSDINNTNRYSQLCTYQMVNGNQKVNNFHPELLENV
jgi:hypothetical protein